MVTPKSVKPLILLHLILLCPRIYRNSTVLSWARLSTLLWYSSKLSGGSYTYQLGLHYCGIRAKWNNYSLTSPTPVHPRSVKLPLLNPSMYQISRSLSNWTFLVHQSSLLRKRILYFFWSKQFERFLLKSVSSCLIYSLNLIYHHFLC